MNAEFINALNELEQEKGIEKEVLLDAIRTALVSAYKRDFGMSQNARVDIDDVTGVINVFAEKTVVDDVFDETFEISLEAVSYTHLDVYKRQVLYHSALYAGTIRNSASCFGAQRWPYHHGRRYLHL